jgi:arylsulfatase A-like enzyme
MGINNKTILIIIICFLVSNIINANSENNPKKLNVLFIIADDLNCDIGVYGSPDVFTPNIDKLASQGVLFENAHVQYPLCGPSRVSLMTGLYPDQTKSKELRLYVRQTIPDVITLGQRFIMEKYNSIRVGKVYHYHNPRDIGTSGHDDHFTWDQTVNPYGRDKIEEYKLNKVKENFDGATLSWLESEGSDNEQTDGIGADETIKFLDKFSKSKENFFLAFGLYRPHIPFVAPKKYFDLYEKDNMTVPSNGDEFLKTISSPAAKSLRARKEQINLDNSIIKTVKEAYYSTTSFVDAQIGRVLDKLKETGLDKNTIVVFTSDHGYHLGEKGHWQKQSLYDRATRVPLIISGPGILSNKRIKNSPVELVDLYKTLMDLTGISSPEFVQGHSLKNILTSNSKPIRKSALSELRVYSDGSLAQGYSIKTDRYRLTRWLHKDERYLELYDHKYDFNENKNLVYEDNYSRVRDSLDIILTKRIEEAQNKPNGLGRQFENAKPTFEPARIQSSKKTIF